MNVRTSLFIGTLMSLTAWPQHAIAFSCDTTWAVKDVNSAENATYLADCRIETTESAPFVVSPGEQAVFTAEQQIRLGPGFHARKGSHFQTRFRGCIRNPKAGTGFASWGDYEFSSVHPDEMWMKRIAERFVENFGGSEDEPLSVALNYERELAAYGVSIPDLYMDYTDPSSGTHVGLDDTRQLVIEDPSTKHGLTVQGIDKGVFFFHVGHGSPEDFDVRNGDGSMVSTSSGPVLQAGTKTDMDYQNHMRLGNCTSNGQATGELRYLWLCSCRAFAHGPSIDGYWTLEDSPVIDAETGLISTESYVWKRSLQYDRPSEYDGSADSESQRNVIERWGPVISENFRIACGVSTKATCSGNTTTNHKTMDQLAENYFDSEMSVADSWGHAFESYWSDRVYLDANREFVREVRQVPLCIARGSFPREAGDEFRSPILDDQRFTNKANPYKGAWHIVSWEREGGTLKKREQAIPSAMPLLYTEKKLPDWLADSRKGLGRPGLLKVKMSSGDTRFKGGMLVSQTSTKDGRPTMKFDTETGAMIYSGERKALKNNAGKGVLAMEDYKDKAAAFIESQGWGEEDMDDLAGIRGMLQVIPEESVGKGSTAIIKTQKDIAFTTGRRITVNGISVRVLGSDNEIAVHMNNDGSVKSAKKRWRKIIGKTDPVAVLGYKDAYAKARDKLPHAGLYSLAGWDWGYKSTIDQSGRDVMSVYYRFSFDPVSIVDDCISQSMVVDVRAQET